MTWQVDNSHSHVGFAVRHMMISKVRGEFTRFEATVNYDEQTPANTTVEAKVYTDSVNTRDSKRDDHLRSPDFFNSAEYPAMIFKSKRVVQESANHGKLIGDLTIRDITREVALDVVNSGVAKSPWGTISAGFSASTVINRTDWGLTWNAALETGGLLVGEQVTIEIELELVQVPEAQAAQVA